MGDVGGYDEAFAWVMLMTVVVFLSKRVHNAGPTCSGVCADPTLKSVKL